MLNSTPQNQVHWLARAPRVLILLAALLCFQTACSVPQKLDPGTVYKRDMRLRVNGQRGTGTLVVPRASKYEIEIEARGKLDLFTLTTCHREVAAEEAWDKGFFKSKKEISTSFIPAMGLEYGNYCPVHFGGYEKSKGRHSWAFLDFETPEATLPASIKCDGRVYQSRGVTVCQSRAGLEQEVIFPVPVRVLPDPACPMVSGLADQVFRFPIVRDHCVYAFKEKTGKRVHRLTTIGYEQILIRED